MKYINNITMSIAVWLIGNRETDKDIFYKRVIANRDEQIRGKDTLIREFETSLVASDQKTLSLELSYNFYRNRYEALSKKHGALIKRLKSLQKKRKPATVKKRKPSR